MTTMADLLPVQIRVTPEGVAEQWLLRELGLDWRDVYKLHGDVIGSPRDYIYCRHGRHGQAPGYYYSAEGIRALADHFGLQVELQLGAVAPATAPTTPPVSQFWWQKENQ